jgi:hypothetical protein
MTPVAWCFPSTEASDTTSALLSVASLLFTTKTLCEHYHNGSQTTALPSPPMRSVIEIRQDGLEWENAQNPQQNANM